MINENHFVGFGIGYSYCPFIPKWPGFGDIFAEYKWYILDKRHTPTLGMRTGLSYHTEGHKLGNDATPSPLFQPNIGWEWNMAKYFSMNLSIGIDLRVEKNEYRTDIEKIPYIMLSWKF